MIPDDVKLFSWIDVEDLLSRLQIPLSGKESHWPQWLIKAEAYWESLELFVSTGTQESEVLDWVKEVFDPRVSKDGKLISLISTESADRSLAVIVTEEEEITEVPLFRPFWTKTKTVYKDWKWSQPEKSLDNPIIAFHSFKGGVGRTTHALATLFALRKQFSEKAPILVVDGDFEAPGLTWLLPQKDYQVSLVDFISLLHGDPDPSFKTSIELVANELQRSTRDNFYILPAIRSNHQQRLMNIRPEHLTRYAQDPYVITHSLDALGKKLSVKAILVDLRAGLSEFSASLMLDPRVQRILVTTLAPQALRGSKEILEIINEVASPRPGDPPHSLVISQIPSDYFSNQALVYSALARQGIVKAFAEGFKYLGDEGNFADQILFTEFNSTLQLLPSDWEDVQGVLDRSGLPEKMGDLNWNTDQPAQIPVQENKKENRDSLAKWTGDLIYGERGRETEFLSIRPLQRLVDNFARQVPIVVVVGAKGSGKTYTFLQMARRKTWGEFARSIFLDRQLENYFTQGNTLVLPVTESLNLSGNAPKIVTDARKNVSTILGQENNDPIVDTKQFLSDPKRKDYSTTQWRDAWLDLIAWRAGYQNGKQGIGREFIDFLLNKKISLVAIFDGLEDNMQELPENEALQTALRSLLQDVPTWLDQQPRKVLGIIVFARPDMVEYSIRYNSAQFLDKYREYALSWSITEALRLVVWAVKQSKALDIKEAIDQIRPEELRDCLQRIWGVKVGSALATRWIINNLSDFRENIQARDMVRFLYYAATHSLTSEDQTRLLTASAVRQALEKVSKDKLDELSIDNLETSENPRLASALKVLQDKKGELELPLTLDELVRLFPEELERDILRLNGVIYQETPNAIHVAEIFRKGLELKFRPSARAWMASLKSGYLP